MSAPNNKDDEALKAAFEVIGEQELQDYQPTPAQRQAAFKLALAAGQRLAKKKDEEAEVMWEQIHVFLSAQIPSPVDDVAKKENE